MGERIVVPRACMCCDCQGRPHGDDPWGTCSVEHRHGCAGGHDKRSPCNDLAAALGITTP